MANNKKTIKINPLDKEESAQKYVIEMTQEDEEENQKDKQIIEIHQSESSELNQTFKNDEFQDDVNESDSDYKENLFLQEKAKNSQEALDLGQEYCNKQEYEKAAKVIQDFFEDVETNKITEQLDQEKLFNLHKDLAEYYKKCNKFTQSLQEFEKALKEIHSEATILKTSKSSEEHYNIRKILCKFSNNI